MDGGAGPFLSSREERTTTQATATSQGAVSKSGATMPSPYAHDPGSRVSEWLQPDRCAALRGGSEGFDRPRVPDGVVATQHQLRLAADRLADVLELEAIGVDGLELDPLRLTPAAELDHGLARVPGIVEEQRSLAPNRLELVPRRQRGATVEEAEDVAWEPQRAGEDPV